MHTHRNSLETVLSVIILMAAFAFIFALAPAQAAADNNPGAQPGSTFQITPVVPGQEPGLPGQDPGAEVEVVPDTGDEAAFPAWLIWLVVIVALVALVVALVGRGGTTLGHHHHDDEI